MLILGAIVLVGLAMLLVLDGWFGHLRVWKQLLAGGIALAVLVLGLMAHGSFALKWLQGQTSFLEPWNVFHYYLNAKYFDELGYTQLYACAYQADQGAGRVFDDRTLPIRDLVTYVEVPRTQLPPCPNGLFTPERWNAFLADLVWLQTQPATLPASYANNVKEYWNNMLLDKGYNLPPPFIVISQRLTQYFPIRDTSFPFALFWIDTILAGLMLFLVGRWKGWRVAGLLCLFLFCFFGTYRELFGLFLQHCWFFCVILSLLFWEKNYIKWSAVMLALAGGMRIFPFFFALGPLLLFGKALRQKDQVQRQLLQPWLIACAATIGVLFILGNFTDHGWKIWPEFFQKMRLHSAYIQHEWFDIGWKNFLSTLSWGSGWTVSRLVIFLTTISVLFFWIRLVLRRSFVESFVLGLIPLYFLLDLSPFYYLCLGLPLLFVFDKTRFPWKLIGSSLFLLLAFHLLFGWLGPEYTNDVLVGLPIAEGLLVSFLLFFFVLAWRAPPIQPTQNKNALDGGVLKAST